MQWRACTARCSSCRTITPACGLPSCSGRIRGRLSGRRPSCPNQESSSMNLSIYDVTVPPYMRALSALGAVLEKARAHAEQDKIDPSVLLGMRLYPDMLPLSKQIQIATDNAKGAAARLAQVEAPKFEDNETSFAQFRERIEKTLGFLKGLSSQQFEGAAERLFSLRDRLRHPATCRGEDWQGRFPRQRLRVMKRALITGITGQDGAYLAELLLGKGYEVHGIKRRASSFNTDRIDHLYQDPHGSQVRLHLHYGDLTDATNLIRIIQQVQPDEIYNLAAQSHVAVSFETPEYTANADA